MIRTIIKYAGLALVIIGIVLVMKNLFNSAANESSNNNNSKKSKAVITTKKTYSATVSLKDSNTKKNIEGATLIIKDKNGNIVNEWTTESGNHIVPDLKNGTYILSEKTAPTGYHLNEDGVTFEIKDKNKEVIMYNIKMTEEEQKSYEQKQRELNTTSNEINVDNTLSEKSIKATIMAIACIISGIVLILHKKEA